MPCVDFFWNACTTQTSNLSLPRPTALADGNARAYAYRMKSPISTAPDVLGGTPVFAGTRVPIQTLLDYLEGGESIDDFLDGFPSVSRDQIISFLEMAKDRLIESAL
jgi:uncharacterized protein (DUF433 family)